jgi:hypothetical protein
MIRSKIINKMNFIISFGQTPHQVFKEPHHQKEKDQNKKEDDERDSLEQFKENVLIDHKYIINCPCLYFEYNISNDKIFVISQNEEIIEINFNLYDGISREIPSLKTSYIQFSEQKTIHQDIDYYIYKPKYAFSSFDIKDDNENLHPKNSQISKEKNNDNFIFNIYYKNIFEKMKNENTNKDKMNEESYKFIQCRCLDNSFKIYKITKKVNQNKNNKEIIKKSYSYICEDFVSSCCSISSNEFLIGLDNGKLIKWLIVNEQKDRIDLIIDKNIQAHKGRINVIEIDKRLGLIITCGNDNLIQIRKLYNLELITPIQIKNKYIITMAKVSPFNFLYVMCYDKQNNISNILGYTLAGIKFAKSNEGFYCNLDFTKNGNIVSFLYNKEICILNGYNLKKKEINEKYYGYDELKRVNKNVKGAIWLEFKYTEKSYQNYIIYIKKGKDVSDNVIFFYKFKENRIFE